MSQMHVCVTADSHDKYHYIFILQIHKLLLSSQSKPKEIDTTNCSEQGEKLFQVKLGKWGEFLRPDAR